MAEIDGRPGRLSGLDSAFLCLESAAAPLHLGGLGVFQPGRRVPPDLLFALLCDRAERIARLRWRVDRSLLWPTPAAWVVDRRFDVRRQVHLHHLPGGDHEQLTALAAGVFGDPLDLHRPPWQLHLVTGLAGGRFAVLLKIHHALADGLRALEIGTGLLDGRPRPAGRGTAARPGQAPASGGLAQRFREAAGRAGTLAGIVGAILADARTDRTASALAGDLTGPAGTGTRRLGLVRLDLSDLRRVRSRHGGTDNDVLLAVLAGALHDWLAAHGRTADPDLRVLVPVSRRRRSAAGPDGSGPAGPGQPGNLLSGYLCPLPVAEPDPVARLQAVRTAMDRQKAAGPTRGAGAFPLLADELPGVLHRLVAPLARHGAGRLFDAVVTNVPVPALPMTLAGAPLHEFYPIPPLAHGQPLAVALSRYQDGVHVGLYLDTRAVPDPDRLTDAIPAALTELVKADRAA